MCTDNWLCVIFVSLHKNRICDAGARLSGTKITHNTLFLANNTSQPHSRNENSNGWTLGKNLPSFKIGISHGRLSNFFRSELTKNTPPLKVGTSHGRLSNFFRSELTKNTPPQSGNFSWMTLELWFWAYQEYPPPTHTHPNCNFSWRTVQGTGVWRLIAVSPTYTV